MGLSVLCHLQSHFLHSVASSDPLLSPSLDVASSDPLLSPSLDVASSDPLLSPSLDVASSDPLLSPSLDVVSCESLSSVDDVSCESPLSLDPEELEDSSLLLSLLLLLSSLDESSSLSEVLGTGVIGTLPLPSSPPFDVASCCESLSSLLLPSSADPEELVVSSALLLLLSLLSLDDNSSLLPKAGVAGVEVLSCAGSCEGMSVEVVFCAKTKFWLKSIVLIISVHSNRTADNIPNFTCLTFINFFSKAAERRQVLSWLIQIYVIFIQ